MNEIFTFALWFFEAGIVVALMVSAFALGCYIVYWVFNFIYQIFTMPAPDDVDEFGNELEVNEN